MSVAEGRGASGMNAGIADAALIYGDPNHWRTTMMERINNEINRRVPHVRTIKELSWQVAEEHRQEVLENFLVGLVFLGLIAIAAAFVLLGHVAP